MGFRVTRLRESGWIELIRRRLIAIGIKQPREPRLLVLEIAVPLDTKKVVAISLKGSPQNGASHSGVEGFRGRTVSVD